MNNPYRVIKQFAFVTGFCIVSCTTALAQQTTFVYLQSENLQPFYVQIGDKVYSSSVVGHLVISGLADKTCNFELGFPQQATRPQRFSIPLHNRDHGYQLQKNGSRGWVLYDWQTDELIKPLKEAGSTLLYGERKKDDAFANLMAAVVNDSAVLYTSIIKKENPAVPTVGNTDAKPEEKQPVAKTGEKPVQPVDTLAGEKEAAVVTVAAPPAAVDSAGIIKTEAVSTDTSTRIGITAADSAVAKYDPKERGLNDKPAAVAGVAKIQHQTKDGETKMVFVDSSESPAKVVTVYIDEDKAAASDKPAEIPAPVQPAVTPPVNDQPVSNVAKSEENPGQPVKDSVQTTVMAEPLKKEEPVAGKEADKPAAALSKEEIAEQIKKETWRSAPEKKANAADTTTVILESRQMKKGDSAKETQPLYRTKEEPKTEPAKPVTRDTVAQSTEPAGTGGGETPETAAADKQEVKAEPVKPAAAEEPVQQEAKVAVDTVKKNSEPATAKKDAETAKQETRPVAARPAETEKPKAVEPEKKTENGSKLVMINSDCIKLATENDIDKMRVKLIAENDSQKRLAVANKYFKTMCLYAHQIKALSELFPGDQAKYKFLEMAYPFAADTANFKTLYELLTEEAYITKFKKMVRLE